VLLVTHIAAGAFLSPEIFELSGFGHATTLQHTCVFRKNLILRQRSQGPQAFASPPRGFSPLPSSGTEEGGSRPSGHKLAYNGYTPCVTPARGGLEQPSVECFQDPSVFLMSFVSRYRW